MARAAAFALLAGGIVTAGMADVLRILDLRLAGADGSWRIRWETTPGQIYQLQRTKDDFLSNDGPIEWSPLATVHATGTEVEAGDTVAPGVPVRFYRVVQLPPAAADTEAPTIVYGGVEPFTTSEGGPAIRVTFSAQDNVGVSSVAVLEGSSVVGQATPAGNGGWKLVLPANFRGAAPRLFTGVATDPSGNRGESVPAGVLTADPDKFVPLDLDGSPREGRLLSAITTNQARAFLYRPGGRPRPGAAPDLTLTFPDGATFLESNSVTTLEFATVKAEFGAGSPLKFSSVLQRTGGPVKRLVIGPLDLADLAGLFDLNPASGLAVMLYNRFPMHWRGGVVDDRGIADAQFSPDIAALPLPELTQAAAGFLVEFSQDRSLRVPFTGEFPLPDGSANAPKLRIGTGDPLWLTIRPDGNISLGGSVEARWPNGQSVRASLRLDDPKYSLALEASGLRIQAASNLVDLLPANPGTCLGSSTTQAQLDAATRCLDKFARAYSHFSALVASSASNAPLSLAEPPGELNVVGEALEAWGFSAATGATQALPLDAIAELVSQSGHQAAASPELPELLAHRLALTRARAAVERGGLSGSASARAQLEAALAEADAAAIDRARNPEAVFSLDAMKQAARLLAETEAARELVAIPSNQLLPELPGLFTRFADRLTDRFKIVANVFTPQTNPAVNTLNRFAAMATLRDLVELQANAQVVGVNLASTRLDELTGQLGVRLLDTVNTALNDAEAATNYPALFLAGQDLMELAGWAQLGLFPAVPELASLRNGSAAASFASRANRLAD
ncbi:MAG TPA: hypothetical protein VHH73_13495, partial [Verrucomicrobiae bacterium]|nr:hypothetical protein [Verrucomicrobiae bacterium]